MSLLLGLSLTITTVHAGPKEDARALSREAYKLEREMAAKLPDIEDRVPELKTLLEESRTATRTVQDALKSHPALADARAKRDQAFQQLTTAISQGDATGKQTAQQAYAQAENNINEEGRKVPEIAGLMDTAANAGATYMKKKEEAYATQPETADMAKQAAELRAKATELRRSAQ